MKSPLAKFLCAMAVLLIAGYAVVALGGPQGIPGPQGDQGVAGPAGEDGSVIYSGTGAPAAFKAFVLLDGNCRENYPVLPLKTLLFS